MVLRTSFEFRAALRYTDNHVTSAALRDGRFASELATSDREAGRQVTDGLLRSIHQR